MCTAVAAPAPEEPVPRQQVEWHPAEVPPANPDRADRTSPKYLAYFHNEFCPDVAKNGVLVPLIVAVIMGVKNLLDGETRRRAALEVGLPKVPVLLIEGPVDPSELEIIKFRLNKKRRQVSVMEETRFLHAIMTARHWTQARLCKELHLNPATVSKQFKVFEKLCEPLRGMVGDGPGMLSLRGAYAICDCPPDQQQAWAARLMNDEMSVEDVEIEVHKAKGVSKPAKKEVAVCRQKVTRVEIIGDDYAAAIPELAAVLEFLRRGEKRKEPIPTVLSQLGNPPRN